MLDFDFCLPTFGQQAQTKLLCLREISLWLTPTERKSNARRITNTPQKPHKRVVNAPQNPQKTRRKRIANSSSARSKHSLRQQHGRFKIFLTSPLPPRHIETHPRYILVRGADSDSDQHSQLTPRSKHPPSPLKSSAPAGLIPFEQLPR